MGRLIKLDSSGDTLLAEWDTAAPATTERARREFDKLVAAGHLIYRADEDTSFAGRQVKAFDPQAKQLIAVRQFAGG